MRARAEALSRWWPLAAPPLAVGLFAVGGEAAQAAVLAAVACALAAALRPGRRLVLGRASALLALAALVDLALVLLLDQFHYRYVWLYSNAALPDLYKLANVWGGDEGTLVLLTALAALAAVRLVRTPGWAGPAALVLVAAFGVGAALWSPFVALPPELAGADAIDGRGMNAHLVRVWMLLHPPFVFVSYTLFLLPCGAALQALATGEGAWEVVAARWVRLGWLTLSAGLVSGMWWAYEDFTFGQFWHWDPVQTSVFMVWALATAHLHTMRRYRADGAHGRLHPALGLATGVAALVSLVVTRQPALASSHRYVGETSFPWLLALAAVLATAALAALALSFRRRLAPRRHDESSVLVLIATVALVVSALAAAGVIAEAFVSHALGLPRPEKFKPFFEFLARWTSSAEVERLRALFDQWDIDRYRINALLAPVGIVVGLAGGHNFVPLRRRRRWAVTAAVALAALAASLAWQPMASAFTGKGMTSTNTTAIFPWLDALAVSMLYLGLAAFAWGANAALRHRRNRAVGSTHLPVGVLHFGIVVALLAAIVASVFDLYNWRQLRFPDDFEKPIRFPWGYEVTVAVDHEALVADGARTGAADGGFRAVARVRWSLARDGATIESADGEAVYRDARAPPLRGLGPVRLMCEILDYRYARTVSGDVQMIDPFIHRGLWRDVQVWLPAVEYRREAEASDTSGLAALRAPSTVPVVLKIFPMMTWLWVGLVVAWLGAAVAMRFEIARAGVPRRR
jgi:cytochrome c-type biogenesis protein CcmF